MSAGRHILIGKRTAQNRRQAMTTPAPVTLPAQPPPDTTFRIDPAPGSQLDTLMDRHATAKARKKEAAEEFDAIDAEVKALTTVVVPEGTERIIIGGSQAGRAAMLLLWKREKRFNTRRFRETYQDLYESFRDWAGHWEMRELGG
jgi:hypothetical protein